METLAGKLRGLVVEEEGSGKEEWTWGTSWVYAWRRKWGYGWGKNGGIRGRGKGGIPY
jgi:hypothetical protein